MLKHFKELNYYLHTSREFNLTTAGTGEESCAFVAALRREVFVVLGPSELLEFLSLLFRLWVVVIVGSLCKLNCAASSFLRCSLYRAIRSDLLSWPSDIVAVVVATVSISANCDEIFGRE